MLARGVHARVAAVVAALLVLATLSAPPAAAVPAAPTGLTPGGGSVQAGIPVLTWERTTGASTYDVQVAAASSFATVLWSASSTVNHQAAPAAQLPSGELWWRVRARDASGTGDWTTATFTRSDVAAPAVTGPADGIELAQPAEPPTLSWLPVSGVTSYTVDISPDEDFTDPARISTTTTKGTSLVLTQLQIPATYHWRVRGQLAAGFTTAWSTPRSYRILGLAKPGLVGPPDDIEQNVKDVVLDWTPVPGAKAYDVQVSTDVNFQTVATSRTNVFGTRWSPAITVPNDQYYWRVRPVDAAGNKLDWSAVTTWKFRRAWPDQPVLEYPGDGATVGNPFYFQWTPVELASKYRLQISTDPSFTVKASCETTHTTMAPRAATSSLPCMPLAAGTFYWRVIALDDPAQVPSDSVLAEVHSFVYMPGTPVLQQPAAGDPVEVPTLSWSPVALATTYRVTVTNASSGAQVATASTAATSYTPTSVLPPGTYRWQVQTETADGRTGPGVLPLHQRTFTVVPQATATAARPEPVGGTGTYDRFPTLRWTPVAGATRYVVRIRRDDTVGWSQLSDAFAYPAGSDRSSTFLVPAAYEWYVEAYNGSAPLGESATHATFTIRALPATADYRTAITGNAITGAGGTTIDACAATLPSECQNLRQTPVLTWAPDARVGFYKLYLSRDSEMTNILTDYPVKVYDTVWAPERALPDSQAGSAYFWQVVPCASETVCAPLGHSDHAFNKLSNQVEAVSPAAGSVISDDVALTWRDLLETEQSASTADTALTTPARTEAGKYLVQVATDPNFQVVIDSAEVDQRTYTAPATTYPEGPVYWRVQAKDGSSNSLPWSATRSFTKASPVPVPTAPATGATVPGDTPLVWQPLDFAFSYDVEVYKNDDRLGNVGNRVVNATSQQVVYAPTTPLPASATPYTWRVRRVDASNRKGGWSSLRPFVVTAPAPTLEAPASGADVPPSDSLFTWDAEPAATTYRWERRRPAASDIAETVTTAGTAWAPSKALAGGLWQWRVTSLDANGAALGSSAWRDFAVHDTPVATTPVGMLGSGGVGTAMTVVPPVWNMPDVVTSYQWLREGKAIPGATGDVYELTTADYGRTVSVRATGARVGYLTGTSTSAGTEVTPGVPLVATAPPVLSGTARAGELLQASAGTWPASASYGYQWLRDGRAIAGATSYRYRVAALDAGHRLAVRVSASSTGYAPGTVASATVAVPRLAATVSATTAPRVTARQRAVLSVSVTVLLTSATGRVTVLEGRRTLATTTLTTAHRGSRTVRLPRLRKGRHVLVVRYLGTPEIAPSAPRRVRLRVG